MCCRLVAVGGGLFSEARNSALPPTTFFCFDNSFDANFATVCSSVLIWDLLLCCVARSASVIGVALLPNGCLLLTILFSLADVCLLPLKGFMSSLFGPLAP